VFGLALTSLAQNFPLINSAVVDYPNTTLTLSDRNFGSSPVVNLGSTPLGVQSSSAIQIVATFPTVSPPSSFAAGDYFLTLRFSNGSAAVFTATLGAVERIAIFKITRG